MDIGSLSLCVKSPSPAGMERGPKRLRAVERESTLNPVPDLGGYETAPGEGPSPKLGGTRTRNLPLSRRALCPG
jgi:hypothetical protein